MTVLKGFVDDSLKRQSFFMILRSATAILFEHVRQSDSD